MMPTRYSVDLSFDKNLVNKDAIKDPVKRKKARFAVRTKFEERYCLRFFKKFLLTDVLIFTDTSPERTAGSSANCDSKCCLVVFRDKINHWDAKFFTLRLFN